MRALTDLVAELIFDSMVSKIQIEMAAVFVGAILKKEGQSSRASTEDATVIQHHVEHLFRSFLSTARKAPAAMQQLQIALDHIEHEVASLFRFMRTLHFIYFAGKVETARLVGMQSFLTIIT